MWSDDTGDIRSKYGMPFIADFGQFIIAIDSSYCTKQKT